MHKPPAVDVGWRLAGASGADVPTADQLPVEGGGPRQKVSHQASKR